MDQLDVALVEAMREHPRVGDLELSRITKVARATVQSRLAKLERAGVISGYGPDIDLVAAGHPVLAFVTLEIAQGMLDAVTDELESLPNVLEAYVTSGTADVVCKIAATSHEDLQATLLHISQSGLGGAVDQRDRAVGAGTPEGPADAQEGRDRQHLKSPGLSVGVSIRPPRSSAALDQRGTLRTQHDSAARGLLR